MTDVRIAVELLGDAFKDRFDVALVVSADSDLVPAVRAVHEGTGGDANLTGRKAVIAAFPPRRRSAQLKRECDSHFTISTSVLENNLLPEVIQRSGKSELVRPPQWN